MNEPDDDRRNRLVIEAEQKGWMLADCIRCGYTWHIIRKQHPYPERCPRCRTRRWHP